MDTEDIVTGSEEKIIGSEENQVENTIQLEEPPTYDDIEKNEWKENIENIEEKEETKENRICANCGGVLREGDRFCSFCGMKCDIMPEELTAATKEEEPQKNADEVNESADGQEEKEETKSDSDIPHICAEELQKSVQKEEELENIQSDRDGTEKRKRRNIRHRSIVQIQMILRRVRSFIIQKKNGVSKYCAWHSKI